MDESDNDSDEWATDEIPDFSAQRTPSGSNDTANILVNDDDDLWQSKLETTNASLNETNSTNNEKVIVGGEPMIIVDMTMLSNLLSLPEIHSRFDPNAVNDIHAVKQLRQQIEQNYMFYSKNNDYLCDRIVIPCGSSVWRVALIELRKERKGHYFCPIFPTKGLK